MAVCAGARVWAYSAGGSVSDGIHRVVLLPGQQRCDSSAIAVTCSALTTLGSWLRDEDAAGPVLGGVGCCSFAAGPSEASRVCRYRGWSWEESVVMRGVVVVAVVVVGGLVGLGCAFSVWLAGSWIERGDAELGPT